jgi:hypothetical protein
MANNRMEPGSHRDAAGVRMSCGHRLMPGVWARLLPTLHASDNAAGCAAASTLALLVSGQVLRDGEIVELVIRPSVWWIIFTSWRFVGVCAILALGGWQIPEALPISRRALAELMLVTASTRVVWASLKWMSRVHILTNLRVLTLSGVFNATIYECPLRKLARARLVSSVRERLLLLGSIEVIPGEEAFPITVWQTIARPKEVYETLQAAMRRAREGPGKG